MAKWRLTLHTILSIDFEIETRNNLPFINWEVSKKKSIFPDHISADCLNIRMAIQEIHGNSQRIKLSILKFLQPEALQAYGFDASTTATGTTSTTITTATTMTTTYTTTTITTTTTTTTTSCNDNIKDCVSKAASSLSGSASDVVSSGALIGEFRKSVEVLHFRFLQWRRFSNWCCCGQSPDQCSSQRRWPWKSSRSEGEPPQCEGKVFAEGWDRKYSKVFYNTLNQKTINESKTYDPSLYNGGSLWSSLGGVLSLFLGISFAMFFEVLSLSWNWH